MATAPSEAPALGTCSSTAHAQTCPPVTAAASRSAPPTTKAANGTPLPDRPWSASADRTPQPRPASAASAAASGSHTTATVGTAGPYALLGSARMATPVIIEAALNGITSRGRNPEVPIAPDELANAAIACVDAGATVVHTHAHNF